MPGMNMGMNNMNGVNMNGMNGMNMNAMNMLGGGSVMAGAMANFDMNNPTHMMAMQALANKNDDGSNSNSANSQLTSVTGLFEQQLRNQQMKQIQNWANQNQEPTCPMVAENKRNSCSAHSGNISKDMNMCQAKGCCFDAMMWDFVDQKKKEEAEQEEAANTARNSNPFRSNNSPFRSRG